MSAPGPIAWWMHNPRRFAVVGVAVLAVLGAVGSATRPAHRVENHAPTTAAPTQTASPETTSTSTARVENHAATPATTTLPSATSPRPGVTSGPPPAGVTQAALAFVTAWARPTVPEPVWLADLRPLATPELAGLLAYTDPANTPAGPVVLVGATGDSGGGQVEIRAGTVNVAVVVQHTAGGYLVAAIER